MIIQVARQIWDYERKRKERRIFALGAVTLSTRIIGCAVRLGVGSPIFCCPFLRPLAGLGPLGLGWAGVSDFW